MTIDEKAINPLHISLEAKIECDHLHQEELQKARKEWLRDEIVKLEGMKEEEWVVRISESDKIGFDISVEYNKAIDDVITRYQAELNKK